MTDKVSVGFICVGNSCRSQMAEGFARKYADSLFNIYSAGTHPASEVHRYAVEVMKEKGIDISGQYPKHLSDIPAGLDIIITMGCGVECPYVPSKHREDWGIKDPVGMELSDFQMIRDIIEAKVLELVKLAEESQGKEEFLNKLGKG